jgi:hypothetical protein
MRLVERIDFLTADITILYPDKASGNRCLFLFQEVIPILSKDTIQSAKSVDLLSYLQRYEPDELVHVAGNEYSTKTHGSLKISNGKWHWFSRGVGGTGALDYLIHVKGLRFSEAVMFLVGQRYQEQIHSQPKPVTNAEKSSRSRAFELPPAFENNNRVNAYLRNRGLSKDVLSFCFRKSLIFEDARYHNSVFVGLDANGSPRHATLRGTTTGNTFRQDAPNSDKRFTFNLPAQSESRILYVFEGAIDLLSWATIEANAGKNWRQHHLLSLGGLASLALNQYLKDHPEIKEIVLCLDRDQPGREATQAFIEKLSYQGFVIRDEPAPSGKDYNEYLCSIRSARNPSPKTESSVPNQLYTR